MNANKGVTFTYTMLATPYLPLFLLTSLYIKISSWPPVRSLAQVTGGRLIPHVYMGFQRDFKAQIALKG